MDWWPKTGLDRVSSSQEEYVDNQFLDVKDIDHSDLDNLEISLSIKTSKSTAERKHSANDAYNKYFYKSNIMIDQIALNLYFNQVEKQNKQEIRFQHYKKGIVAVELILIEALINVIAGHSIANDFCFIFVDKKWDLNHSM